jgi:predicted dehydrogenase
MMISVSDRHGEPRGGDMGERLHIGLIGAGLIGQKHADYLKASGDADLIAIADPAPAAAAVATEHGAAFHADYNRMFGCERLDGVIIAAPNHLHEATAIAAAGRGLPMLVEKPIATDLAGADRLLASRGDRVLAVGHVEFYNPSVRALAETRPSPSFVEIQRLSVFSPRSLDIDVILDLMIHDLQILHALDPTPVREVRAAGVAVLSDRIDIANARVELESGCVANLTASRVSSEKVRRLRLFSRQRYYSLDYQEQTLKGYRLEEVEPAGAASRSLEAGGQTPQGAVVHPSRRIAALDLAVARAEPLRRELEAFVGACRGEQVAYVDGRSGRAALASALAIARAAASPGGGAE